MSVTAGVTLPSFHMYTAADMISLRGSLLPETIGSISIGKVNRAVAFGDDVVWAAETLALVTVCEHSALAVLLDPHERAAGVGRDDQPALGIEGQAVGANHRELFNCGSVRSRPLF